MANDYILLDSKRYAVFATRYEPQLQKRLSVDVTVGGTTVSQQFSFMDYLWAFDLAVPYTPADLEYGNLDDLKVAYAKPYVDFTDHYDGSHQVFMLGGLGEKPLSPAIAGEATCTVPVTLRKRQV